MLCKSQLFILSLLLCIYHSSCQLGQSKSVIDVALEARLTSPCPNVTATMVVLTFPPGDTGSDPHTHPGPVTGYVLQGEFLFQVNNEPRRILRAGDAFSENKGDVHVWSANASDRTTCKVVATVWGVEGQPVLNYIPNYPRESRAEALQLASGGQLRGGY